MVGPKSHFDPPEPKLVTNPLDPKLAKDPLDTNLARNAVGPNFRHRPPWTNISAMASGNHQRPPNQLSQLAPQLMGNPFHSFTPSVLKVAGKVHIWYYIPFCTVFAQHSNGDAFRTQFHLSISRSQDPKPISKEDYSVHQSEKLWRKSEDSSRIPTTSICRGWIFGHIQPPINTKCHKWCYTPLCTFFHQKSNGAQMKWLFQLFTQFIKAARYPEDSTRLKDQCQS
ncbi:hypothetical protein O181_075948 [Austropuccinia psidii MF-1]|uniref:Uncharacterized protein n=1 Tax=Austropuccinia psidii MF-1 TaxID=1389203 RepID=A0A9Q3FE03_9BASI|nr:hypothetical protein [Austropuccinia psidii MF-1]